MAGDEDVHHSGKVVLPWLRMPFVAFTEEMLREATRFAEFVRRVREELRRLAGAGIDIADIEHHLPVTLDVLQAGKPAARMRSWAP